MAAAYARRAITDRVGLVAWVSADDHGRLLAGLGEVAYRLGVATPTGIRRISAGRLRDELAARSETAVLVLDNATDPQDVSRYVPAVGATRVIITSTDLGAFDRAGADVPVDRFDRGQSLAYLQARTGLSDQEASGRVAEELDDLPLAIAQAASVIMRESLSYRDYLDRFHALALDEVLPVDRGDRYPDGLARAIVLSIDAVQAADHSELTKQTLAATALLAADGVSRPVLASILGADRDTAPQARRGAGAGR